MIGTGLSQARLEHLYEISKLFANFENVEHTLDPALGIASKTLPLRSAILIETEDSHTKMTIWSSEGQGSDRMGPAKEHLESAYAYLVGASTPSSERSQQAGMTPLPWRGSLEEGHSNRFIVIPLVVAAHRPFGALQLEGARALDKTDLMFVNVIANQLAIALDRDLAWRRDIERRLSAETAKERCEMLAADNAKLYEQARQAVRMREEVLNIVSHDLRGPLSTILMTTTLLAKRLVSEERRKGLPEAVARIQRSADRMTRLIEDLLDFTSIEAGRLTIVPGPADAASIIKETLSSFDGLMKDKGLQLTAEVAPHLPSIHCDRDRILQVLSNLVGNAANATAKGGQISLQVRAHGQEVMFAVADTGPGISQDDARHLFERYWRSDDAHYRGTGLGLAIALGIVSAHGGKIWLESELGHGATFYFTVPQAVAAQQPTTTLTRTTH